MKPEWKKYTGSSEQIAKINSSTLKNGYSLRYADGSTTLPLWDAIVELDPKFQPTHYLICAPRRYANMIRQQASTGQPVHIRVKRTVPAGALKVDVIITCSVSTDPEKTAYTWVTNTPDWNIPGAEYSFTPFEEEV